MVNLSISISSDLCILEHEEGIALISDRDDKRITPIGKVYEKT